MSKKNDDFFRTKKEWSKVKDDLLGCYFKPYMQKILYTRKSIIYVDCFAGKGIFEDGQKGSPLIALDVMQECLEKTKVDKYSIEPYFIDLNYADDLHNNLCTYKNIHIISGKFEDNILKILQDKKGCNVFLYIDPYGIKALDCNMFDSFAKKFNSIEMLINMNTFGFLREACRVLGTEFGETKILSDLIEYDQTQLQPNNQSKETLNRICGGDYWIKIIEGYKLGSYDIYKAEKMFSQQYCKRLCQSFKYVLNMPLKIKKGQIPKYRMIHVTNHPDGCLLMADNIQDRWEYMDNIQTGGQMSLFEQTPDDEIIDQDRIKGYVQEYLSKNNKMDRLNNIMANLFTTYGPICKTRTIKNIFKELEKENYIDVIRNPAFTSKGKTSTFFADEKGKTTEIRWHK